MTSRRAYFLGSITLLALIFAVGAFLEVRAQTDSAAGEPQINAEQTITFPIPELGSCGSKSECQKFCSDTANIPACTAFAEAHGLMNKGEAERARKFSATLRNQGGPGGCRSQGECQKFCSNIQNIEACVAFAEAHEGINAEHLVRARKLIAHLKAGGHPPGNCTSKESCEAYCHDLKNAEECIVFARATGMEGDTEGPPPEVMRRFAQLAASGETPGKCTAKEACEAYCREEAHHEECIAFGKKIGLISAEQERGFRNTGGKGPGGCDSSASCQAYCNDPAHREECYKFAQEHGLLKKEDLERAKEGLIHLRAGLEQAPPEVAACLKSTLGTNILDQIQSGELVPGREIGESVRACFEKFGHQRSSGAVFREGSPEVMRCLGDKIGAEALAQLRSGTTQPTPEIADAFRVCAQSLQLQKPGPNRGPQSNPGFQEFLRNAPPQVLSCLKEKLGDDFEKLQTGGGAEISVDIRARMQSCFQTFRPAPEKMERPGAVPQLPAPVLECLKQSLGEEAVREILQGNKPGAEVQAAMQECVQKLRQNLQQNVPTRPAFPGNILNALRSIFR